MPISNQASDPVARALSELEPGTRAMLDLSLRRSLPDEELSKLVAADPAEIALRRERALDEIAAKAGIEGPGARDRVTAWLLAVPSEVWLASVESGAPEPRPAPAAPRPPIKDARRTIATSPRASLGPPSGPGGSAPVGGSPTRADAAQPPPRSRNRVIVLLALLLAAALLAVLLLQMAGGSDEGASAPGPTPEAPAEPMPTSHFQAPVIQLDRA